MSTELATECLPPAPFGPSKVTVTASGRTDRKGKRGALAGALADDLHREPGALCLEILALLEKQHGSVTRRLEKCLAQQDALMQSILSQGGGIHRMGSRESGSLDGSIEIGEELGEGEPEPAPACADLDNFVQKHEVAIKTDGDDHSDDSEDQRRRASAFEVGAVNACSEADGSERQRAHKSQFRRWLLVKLNSTFVEIFLAAAILTNSLLIGAEVEWMAQHPGLNPPKVFMIIDLFYTTFFLVELLARWWAEGTRRFYKTADWAWNVLDLIIVATSLVEAGVNLFSSVSGVDNMSNLRIMRVFRIVRVGKALRIQRLIRFINALRTLVYSIFVTLRSLVWALILLLIIMYIFGIVITQSTTEHIYMGGNDVHPRLGKFWGSLGASMLTLFESVTGGISWYEVIDPLEEVSSVLVWVFITYIFLITFAVFNVITGIFCHSAIETAVRDPDLAAQALLTDKKQYIQRIKKLFRDVDEDRSGVISLQELETVVKDENVRAYFAALDLDLSDAWQVFKLIAGKKNMIDEDAFVQGCLKLRGHARRVDCASVMADTQVLLRRFSAFVKFTTQKLESMAQRPSQPRMLRAGSDGSISHGSASQWRMGSKGSAASPPVVHGRA